MDSIEKARKILRTGIPWLELDIPFNVDVWKQQALEAEPYYQDYRESYAMGWSSCCLHGLDVNKIYTADNYGYNEYHAPYQYTDLAYKCPVITDFWKHQFPAERYTRIRFMKLNPWGNFNKHTDGEIPEDMNWVSEFELPIPKSSNKVAVFGKPAGDDGVYIGLTDVAHELTDPPKTKIGIAIPARRSSIASSMYATPRESAPSS